MYLYVRNLKSFHYLIIKLTFIVFSIKMQIIYILSFSIVAFGLWVQIKKCNIRLKVYIFQMVIFW